MNPLGEERHGYAFYSQRKRQCGNAFCALSACHFFVIGTAIDFTRLQNARAKTQDALDSAVLAASRSLVFDPNVNMAFQRGENQYKAECRGQVCEGTVAQIRYDASSGSEFSATADFSVPTTFLSVAGMNTLSASVSSAAMVNGSFRNFVFIVDRSASLSLAANDFEMASLMTATQPYIVGTGFNSHPDGCAFACHTSIGSEPLRPDGTRTTFYDIARSAGIQLREDVLDSAVEAAVDSLLKPALNSQLVDFSASVYVFSNDYEKVVDEVRSADNIVNQIQASTIVRESTNFNMALPAILRELGQQGDGRSSFSPKKTVILVTDGLHLWRWLDGPRRIEAPLNTALCDRYKAADYRLIVFNLTYPRIPGDRFWDETAAPIYDSLAPALKDCATPGNYFVADDIESIQRGFDKIVEDLLLSEVHLTR